MESFRRGKNITLTVPMKTPGGGKLICNLDDWIPWSVYLHGYYHAEREIEAFMLDYVSAGNTILDIGANIGYYTVQFGRMVGPNGSVHAFEPLSHQHSILAQNIALNGLSTVTVNKQIATDGPGEKRIYFAGKYSTGSSSMQVETSEYEDVPCTALDEYCQQQTITQIDLVKIDVEGHEYFVLEGMRKLLEKKAIKRLFVEINSEALLAAGHTPKDIVERLTSFGYSPWFKDNCDIKPYTDYQDYGLVLFEA